MRSGGAPPRRIVGAFIAVAACLVAAAVEAQPRRQAPPEIPRPAPPQRQTERPLGPSASWVDVHMHLVAAGRGAGADFAGAVDAAIREMDRVGIATAIVLPPPQVDSQAATYDYSSYSRALRRHPGRFAFLGGGGILNSVIHRHADPANVTEAVKRDFAAMAEKVLAEGAAGFGEIASLHVSHVEGHPYEFVPADHPLIRVLADVAADRDVPIDLHMDATDGAVPTPRTLSVPPNPAKLPDTMAPLARLLAHNPKARIVWAHGGSDPLGAMTAETMGRLMDRHANLYVSLRIHPPRAPFQNQAMTDAGLDPAWKDLLVRHVDRFVIGTDSFVASQATRGGAPGLSFAKHNAPKLAATVRFLSLLPADVAPKIGAENAARIYRLAARN